MTAIGFVTRNDNGGFRGELKTLSIRAHIDIVPNSGKSTEAQPDFRILAQGVEIGAGWIRRGESSGKDYVSLSLAAPELGSRKLYANLGRAVGLGDDNGFFLIWNPGD
ncbi:MULTISPECIES: DUF736 domain-containing protein [Bradyrhizobium]|uniref:DUF736 domain-containing protein n=1 Tax=Bradyrhizobium tropiciagri TaxID=312253 RepID=UPI001BADEEC4|nr:DUF736 family protein [Bradyrhizobium tropiciagri]MBR0897596.1 DUF736 family protein [Bradyrhizobium tropiciagri]